MAWALGIAIKILPAASRAVLRAPGSTGACARRALAALVVLCLAPALTMGASIEALTREYLGSFLRGSYAGRRYRRRSTSVSAASWPAVMGADGPPVRQLGTVVPILAILVIDLLARAFRGFRRACVRAVSRGDPMASPKSEIHHLAFALPAAVLAFGAAWFAIDRRPVFLVLLGFTAVSYASALMLPRLERSLLVRVRAAAVSCATAARVKAR
jgi:hypothetical protein